MGTVSSYRHVLHQTKAAHLQNHCRECGNRRTWLGLGIWVNNHMQELVWVCFKKHVDFSVFSHTPCYSFRATWSRTEFPNWEIRPSDKPRRYKNVKEQWKTLKNGCKKLESELRTGSSSDRSAQLIFLHVLKIHHICMAKSFMFQVTLKENLSTIHSSRPLECETLAMGAHLLLTVISLFKSHKAWTKNGPMMSHVTCLKSRLEMLAGWLQTGLNSCTARITTKFNLEPWLSYTYH